MGMSASQARFLCLTARKSNIEFEGQQINQQRTSLSNTSGAYYSELCNMVVPTPPSIDDFTKVTYSFNDGALTNTITSMIAQKDGFYSISYLQQWQDDYSIVSAASSAITKSVHGAQYLTDEQINKLAYYYIDPEYDEIAALTKNEDGTYSYVAANGETVTIDENNENFVMALVDENSDNADDITLVEKTEDGRYVTVSEGQQAGDTVTYSIGNDKLRKAGEKPSDEYIAADKYLKGLSDDQIDELMEQEDYYLTLLNEKNGTEGENYYVRYIKDVATGSYVPYFYKESELQDEGEYQNNLATSVDCFTVGSATKTKEVLNQIGKVEKDSTGRYIGITLYPYKQDTDGSQIPDYEKGIEHSLTVNTTYDQVAYDDALNKYNYEQYQYDQKVQDINSKIEIIQQQDKSLELELKHLDTEHSAIDAEIEAVKKVISKNVDGSFKTFNA